MANERRCPICARKRGVGYVCSRWCKNCADAFAKSKATEAQGWVEWAARRARYFARKDSTDGK